MEEIWKDIDGFENEYQVSNIGRVQSLPRYVILNYKSGRISFCRREGRILKQKHDKDGYLLVGLGKGVTRKVHRLVAQAFCDGYLKDKQVNHKDENKENNRADNLECCTSKYNNCYGTHLQRSGIKHRKPIYQKTLEGEIIRKFDSLLAAEQFLQIKGASTPISRCCKGTMKRVYGYTWSYAL